MSILTALFAAGERVASASDDIFSLAHHHRIGPKTHRRPARNGFDPRINRWTGQPHEHMRERIRTLGQQMNRVTNAAIRAGVINHPSEWTGWARANPMAAASLMAPIVAPVRPEPVEGPSA
ncbi:MULTISPECIES: hypothetical protein [Novosphingobium]|uniref:hypothetical protein n=1 Tax=Novosphingobium TaxID=165696 RepID=UPI000D2F6E45|nr:MULTISPECIES: hypothetical protein [Novosphingobium]WQD93744.1 hypothetical protein U0041_03875 [Novosphingobium capsulatum]